jgi:glutamate-1-semialdehyde 2,1-aminomutase
VTEPQLTEYDRFIWDREIADVLPDRLFDAHTHLIRNDLHPEIETRVPLATKPGLGNIDLASLETGWRVLLPDKEVTGLAMGFPSRDCDWQAENEWVAEQCAGTDHRSALLVHPEYAPDALEADIKRLHPAVLKPYMVFTRHHNPEDTTITDMMPEALLAVADRHKLAVILHAGRGRGMADPENLAQINRLARNYPGCIFILAHCGRCFIPTNMADTLDGLDDNENIFFDTSAVCNSAVFDILLRGWDRRRILFGSDLITASAFRGSYIRLGMGWHLCEAERLPRTHRATFALYENLAALAHALQTARLSPGEITALFHDNARRILDL